MANGISFDRRFLNPAAARMIGGVPRAPLLLLRGLANFVRRFKLLRLAFRDSLAGIVKRGCARSRRPAVALPPLPGVDAIALDARFERAHLGEAQTMAEAAEMAAELVTRDHQERRKNRPLAKAHRDQHAKSHGTVRARFEVRPDLPEHLRAGVLRPGQCYDAWIRFSNASGSVQRDAKGDGRGLAIKLLDVAGDRLSGALETKDRLDDLARTEQDFLFTDHPVFFAGTPSEYLEFLKITLDPDAGVLAKAVRVVGFFLFTSNPRKGLIAAASLVGKTYSPLEIPYFSMTAYRLGEDRVVRHLVRPIDRGSGHPIGSRRRSRLGFDYLRRVMARRLNPGGPRPVPACLEFAVQELADPTPELVEDPSRKWPSERNPLVPVARIEIAPQAFDTAARAHAGENLMFSPWNGLVAHRPLGGLNRMRLAVYLASARTRRRRNLVAPKSC